MVKGYARVSSKDQNLARQLKALSEEGCQKIYQDKQSGKDFDREQYKLMISELTEDDTLVIMSIDRLGRNYEEIIDQWRMITKEIKSKIKVLDMPLLDTTRSNTKDLTDTFIADLVLQILSYVANLEREHIRERQREGIEIAKAQGKYKGRSKKRINEKLFTEMLEKYRNGEIIKKEFADIMNVSVPTLNNLIREREGNNG